MSVEFDCPSCGGRLRTPDGSEGRKAKCPKCEAIVDIPAEPMTPISRPVSPVVVPASGSSTLRTDRSMLGPGGESTSISDFSPRHADPANPYAAPSIHPSIRPADLTTAGDTDVGSMLSSAWASFRRAPGILIGAMLLAGLLSSPPSMLGRTLLEFAASDTGENGLVLGIIGMLVVIGSYPLQIWMQLGQMRIALGAARGEDVRIGTLFSCGGRILPCIGAYLVIGALFVLSAIPAAIVGAMEMNLLLIVGILILLLVFSYFSVACWPFMLLILEGRAGALNCLVAATRLTKGHRFTTFILMIVSACIVVAGFLALLVGLLVALPFVSVLWAVFYSRLVGVPTVAANDQSF
ncbi:MAG: hypothetical protein O3C60_09260 [Planctomycetota bacterium]|nr:hypothetical protein [Planctomycetota bacterium]